MTVVAAAQPENPPGTSTVVVAPPPAAAATGKIHGRVLTKSGEGVAAAVVTAGGSSAMTDAEGNYELDGVAAGAQTISIEATGYATRQSQVDVIAGRIASVVSSMDTAEIPGEEIVVVGTRLPEKRLDAPVTIEIVTEKDLKTTPGVSYLSALSRVKGIDFSEAGIGDTRVSARGFATQFNSRMITMIDGRLATLPGNGLPQGSLLPTSNLDMKSVEVVVGPASALYGPNAHTGVINVVTKTPWDDSGAAVSLRGGTQSMFDGAARVAGTIADTFGYKVNGEYLRAKDFVPDRATHSYAPNIFEGDLLDNYDVHSAKTDGTLYYKHGDWLASTGAGYSNSTGFSITNAGRNHLRGWGVQYETAQLSGEHLYAQVTRTATDAGKSYQLDRLAKTVAAMGGVPANPADLDALRDKIAFIDSSSLIDSDLQLRENIAGVKTTLGGQYRHYAPSSAGTYLDDAMNPISITEAGTYIQLDTTLRDKLRLAAAARADHHSIYGTQVSPKAAIQYEIVPSQNIRFGYNRAFKSPTVLEDYLKIGDNLLGNRTGFLVHDAAGNVISDIAPLKPEQVDALELGYKGAIGEKIYVDAVAYQSWYHDFISALTSIANPTGPNPTFATYRDGTPVAQGTPTEGALSTYMNFGKATIRGLDVGADYRPVPELTLSASASAMKLVSFSSSNPLQKDLLLNAPEYKVRASIQADDLGIKNSFGRVDGRFHTSYAFASGYWNSMALLGGNVPSRAVVDLTVGYKLPKQGVTISGTVVNLFDDRIPDLLGAPIPRRFAWLQVAYDLSGLRY